MAEFGSEAGLLVAPEGNVGLQVAPLGTAATSACGNTE